MASQFVIKQNGLGGFNVLQRELVSAEQLNAHFHHLVSHAGWSPADAAIELEKMSGFVQRNMSENNSFAISRDFVFTYAEPGDVLSMPEQVYVVNRPASA